MFGLSIRDAIKSEGNRRGIVTGTEKTNKQIKEELSLRILTGSLSSRAAIH